MATHYVDNAVTVEDIKRDVKVASSRYHYNDYCFTWPTVLFLLETIAELEEKIMHDVLDAKEAIARGENNA